MGPCRPRTDLAKLTKGQVVQEKLNGRWTRVALDRGMEPHKVKRDRRCQYLRFLNREFRVTI